MMMEFLLERNIKSSNNYSHYHNLQTMRLHSGIIPGYMCHEHILCAIAFQNFIGVHYYTVINLSYIFLDAQSNHDSLVG